MANYSTQELENSYKNMMNVSFLYLDHLLKEIQNLTIKKELTEKEQELFQSLHKFMATILDISHRGFPLCYKIFDKKESLDHVYSLYKKFEDGKLLNPCPCSWCKDQKSESSTTEPQEVLNTKEETLQSDVK